MRGIPGDYLLGVVALAVGLGTLLAALVVVAPRVLPEPFRTAAAAGNVWIAGVAALTVLGTLLVLLVNRTLY